MMFTNFDLEDCGSESDAVDVSDEGAYRDIGRFCNQRTAFLIRSYSENLLLQFRTNAENELNGFNFEISFVSKFMIFIIFFYNNICECLPKIK